MHCFEPATEGSEMDGDAAWDEGRGARGERAEEGVCYRTRHGWGWGGGKAVATNVCVCVQGKGSKGWYACASVCENECVSRRIVVLSCPTESRELSQGRKGGGGVCPKIAGSRRCKVVVGGNICINGIGSQQKLEGSYGAAPPAACYGHGSASAL